MAHKQEGDGQYLSFHLISTRSAAIFSFMLYFSFIFAVAWMAGEELFTVFLGFFAVFLYLIATFVLLYLDFAMAEIVYLFPLVLGAGFYALWYFDVSPLLSAMNGPMLTILNIIVSFVFAALLSILHPHGVDSLRGGKGLKIEHPEPILPDSHEEVSFEKTHSSHHIPEIKSLPIASKPMSVTIRGIEDKSKAINFVIGRVYSAKRGGSKEIREMIGIPKELYNAFSELVQDDDNIVDPKELLAVVKAIQEKLHQLEQKESDLFRLKKAKIEMERSSDGSDTVISVLSQNDKDPVGEYHSEALEVCSQVISYLEQM